CAASAVSIRCCGPRLRSLAGSCATSSSTGSEVARRRERSATSAAWGRRGSSPTRSSASQWPGSATACSATKRATTCGNWLLGRPVTTLRFDPAVLADAVAAVEQVHRATRHEPALGVNLVLAVVLTDAADNLLV